MEHKNISTDLVAQRLTNETLPIRHYWQYQCSTKDNNECSCKKSYTRHYRQTKKPSLRFQFAKKERFSRRIPAAMFAKSFAPCGVRYIMTFSLSLFLSYIFYLSTSVSLLCYPFCLSFSVAFCTSILCYSFSLFNVSLIFSTIALSSLFSPFFALNLSYLSNCVSLISLSPA